MKGGSRANRRRHKKNVLVLYGAKTESQINVSHAKVVTVGSDRVGERTEMLGL